MVIIIGFWATAHPIMDNQDHDDHKQTSKKTGSSVVF